MDEHRNNVGDGAQVTHPEQEALSVSEVFGLDPERTGNRPRSWWIVDAGESNDLSAFNGLNIPAGSLAVHTRDGANNPISPEACRHPNFIGTVEDDFDRTYRNYYYAPVSALRAASEASQ